MQTPFEDSGVTDAGGAPARHRAPAMSGDERRGEILAATLPLLAEYGANVTTSQIAQAAGIAEGTIFRVFKDKHELLLAALRGAMSADDEVARIGLIPSELPLADRLIAALAAVSDYQDRLWSLMRVLHASGWLPAHGASEEDQTPPRHQLRRIAQAIADLFHATDSLRLDPGQAARMLLGLAFSNRKHERGIADRTASGEQIVDLFLHGALGSMTGDGPAATPGGDSPERLTRGRGTRVTAGD
ncbi:MAG: TetR/AcrR family transcriptional regulator [Chloroflexota bacterium]